MSTTLTLEQRIQAIQAARKAGQQPSNTDVPIAERIGKVMANVEHSVKRSASRYLDARIALKEARQEEGCRF